MGFGPADRDRPRIGALRMALALIVAAFLGGALGLVWQSTNLSLGGEDEEDVPTRQAPAPPASG
ncbi:hypothetical protein [Alteraurantiacibacter aquimixticola]|uniref:Uncharacterized protein n=1 Tax=Alteraurantiacibacter aquimixticola TaxID=2489173 RepID=A0A4T3F3R0_9SPHN|nr:hypothetical protein [Alteraurantiacibacter aquimixticola]TIX51079.1 hypothetical protein E5222_00915 [Alteraurantiacibacter aquimixticola]